MRRTLLVLVGVVAAYAGLEAFFFHSSRYARLVNPDSAAGYLETVLGNEMRRPRDSRPQILGVGDSRMALQPRIANQYSAQTGYTFASIGVAGATPRCWYYMLRDLDPAANRYSAIVITVDSYDDEEYWEDLADRETDLHYLIARLRMSDLLEFTRSHHSRLRQWEAFRGILLKGFVYKRDLADFLLSPKARLKYVRMNRRESHNWFYDFVDTYDSLKDVRVDFAARTVTAPPSVPEERRKAIQSRLFEPLVPVMGHRSAYMHYWLTKICDLYRGSRTRLVFLREARGGWIRADQPPVDPHSSVRELAADRKDVTLLPEHFFDALERPEFFKDEVHLNEAGLTEFSRMLAFELRDLLRNPSGGESRSGLVPRLDHGPLPAVTAR